MNLLNTRTLLVIATAVLLAAGCSQDNKPKLSVNDYFEPDSQERSVQKIFAQQHTNAARQDGMLYAAHFTGGELNSLGLQKLNSMLAGPERGPVNIYLSIPKDNTYGPREASVIAQLSARGLASNSYTITAGDNPNVGAPAAQGLNGLAKQSEGEGGSMEEKKMKALGSGIGGAMK